MLNDEIRRKFRQIKYIGERNPKSSAEKLFSDMSVIEYMNYLLANRTNDLFDTGFCLWNISDSYALMRDGEKLYKNHKRFAAFLSDKPSIYGFWTVSDTTQRFTLVSSGYESFWYELYYNVSENCEVTSENYRISYEMHRAALAVHTSLEIPEEHLLYADKKFSEFVENTKDADENDFYKLMYLTSVIKAFKRTDIDVENLCRDFLENLVSDDTPSEFVCGEWEYLNRKRSPKNRANVCITAAVNALIDVGEMRRAAEIYNEAKKRGLPVNTYIEKRLVH
ncbi:MAG: hypothetical protein NC253_07480 [Ruminococcus sp.]|nr:hypothetical protein [Ruminococcus sp.]MCM1479316.1 hypothetical protein [Muribaculaceae bacterium]